MSPPDRRERARALVLVALSEVEAELRAPCQRLGAVELGTCQETLRGYLTALEGGALPPRRERPEGLCRLVLDSWPYDLPLANAVLQAERAWRNA
jgi:hypothetical protein